MQEGGKISPLHLLTFHQLCKTLSMHCVCAQPPFFLLFPGFSPTSAWSLAASPVWQHIWWKSKNNKSAEWIQQMYYTFLKHRCRAEAVRGEMNCKSGDMQPIWPLLGASYPRVAWPSLRPWCPPLVTHCNLWCWEITGAGRPGRYSQLGGAPPVRWGHSQPQIDTLISHPKMWVFQSFSKGFTCMYQTLFFSSASI